MKKGFPLPPKKEMTPEERARRTAQLKPYQFKKGQSGNLGGRPKGPAYLSRAVKKEIQIAADLQIGVDAKKLLNKSSGDITLEILRIALKKEDKPTQAKVKCLLACFERIVPALKVVELKDAGVDKKASDMTDAEILELMTRMVDMAQSKPQIPESLDG